MGLLTPNFGAEIANMTEKWIAGSFHIPCMLA